MILPLTKLVTAKTYFWKQTMTVLFTAIYWTKMIRQQVLQYVNEYKQNIVCLMAVLKRNCYIDKALAFKKGLINTMTRASITNPIGVFLKQ